MKILNKFADKMQQTSSKKRPLMEKIMGDGKRTIVRRSTRRIVMQMGFACNARCSFCYYAESVRNQTTKDFSTDEVKRRLREAKQLGIDQVDLSGGEPTIRPDLIEIIKYAKDIGYIQICVITNGIRMANEDYANSLVDAGMNDILFSTHGTTQEEHERLVKVPGSYDKIWKSVENISKRKEVELRFNMTVTNINYKNCDEFLKKVIDYKPSEVNFLVFNPSQEASKSVDTDGVSFTSYNQIGDAISNAIEKYHDKLNIINVRWIPYCIIKGHEKNIRTMWQKVYEDKEWDPHLNIKHNINGYASLLAGFAGFFLYPFRAPRYGERNWYTKWNEMISTYRQTHYYKHQKACKKCSLKKICPGLPKNYVEKVNKTELKPYKLGKVVTDPLEYCKDYPEKFTSLRL